MVQGRVCQGHSVSSWAPKHVLVTAIEEVCNVVLVQLLLIKRSEPLGSGLSNLLGQTNRLMLARFLYVSFLQQQMKGSDSPDNQRNTEQFVTFCKKRCISSARNDVVGMQLTSSLRYCCTLSLRSSRRRLLPVDLQVFLRCWADPPVGGLSSSLQRNP